jgi:hypothetical protein
MLRIEQTPKLNPKHTRNIREPGYRWRIHAALHQSNEIDRIVCSFGELFLSQPRLTPKVCDVLAEQPIQIRHRKSLEDLHLNLTLS